MTCHRILFDRYHDADPGLPRRELVEDRLEGHTLPRPLGLGTTRRWSEALRLGHCDTLLSEQRVSRASRCFDIEIVLGLIPTSSNSDAIIRLALTRVLCVAFVSLARDRSLTERSRLIRRFDEA